jgi:DNA-binding TFAR19-related protein (PDSD5 family)
MPVDDQQRREMAAQEMEAMLQSLPADQRMHAMIEDDALAQVLGRIGLMLENSASSLNGQNPGMDL